MVVLRCQGGEKQGRGDLLTLVVESVDHECGVEVWGPWRGGAKVSSLTMVKSWHGV
jgi:hypothetical protein